MVSVCHFDEHRLVPAFVDTRQRTYNDTGGRPPAGIWHNFSRGILDDPIWLARLFHRKFSNFGRGQKFCSEHSDINCGTGHLSSKCRLVGSLDGVGITAGCSDVNNVRKSIEQVEHGSAQNLAKMTKRYRVKMSNPLKYIGERGGTRVSGIGCLE